MEKVIGVYGIAGSGKTTLINLIKQRKNVLEIHQKIIFQYIVSPGQKGYKFIKKYFSDAIEKDKSTNVDKVLFLAAYDEEKARILYKEIFPLVDKEIVKIIKENSELDDEYDYFLIEIFSFDDEFLKNICEEVWYISTDYENRVERICKRDNCSKEIALKLAYDYNNKDAYYQKKCARTFINDKDNFEGITSLLNIIL